MFIVDSKGVARSCRRGWPNEPQRKPISDEQKSVQSKSWFDKGSDCLEQMRYDEALFCFEKARRLGHPQSARAVTLCREKLGQNTGRVA
jgi:hypothetical protein